MLGSATPSVESHANALAGKYRRLVLGDADRPAGPAAGRDRRPARGPAGGGRPDPQPASASRPLEARLARREQSAAAPQPPRLRDEPALPRVRPAGGVPELLRLADPSPRAAATPCATTAATARKAPAACAVCRGSTSGCSGFGTERVAEAVQAALPTARIERLDRDPARRRGAVAARPRRVRGGGDRHPGGDADDRQGARLPAGDAGGRHRRRRGPRHAGLPGRRADVPAPDPGRGPRGARRAGGRGRSCRATCPTTTRSASPARRTTRRSSSARWSSGGRWATRRARRS